MEQQRGGRLSGSQRSLFREVQSGRLPSVQEDGGGEMKRVTVKLVALVILALLSSCDDNEAPPEGDLKIVSLTFFTSSLCDGASGACYLHYKLLFKDSLGGVFVYRCRIYDQVREYVSAPRVISSAGSGETVETVVDIPYYCGLPNGQYNLELLRFNSQADARAMASRSASATSTTTLSLSSFGSGCDSACCTCIQNEGYYYVTVQKVEPDIEGVKAWIRHKQTPKMCGWLSESNSIRHAHSNAHIAVADLSDVLNVRPQRYAENGYLVWRDEGTISVRAGWYAVIAVPGKPPFTYRRGMSEPDPPPLSLSDPNLYEMEVNTGTGEWTFDVNYWGQPLDPPPPAYDSGWMSGGGEMASWNGEVLGHETDMVGDADVACEFTECRYCVGNTWSYLDFEHDNSIRINSDDPKEWFIGVVHGTTAAFRFYDKHLQLR